MGSPLSEDRIRAIVAHVAHLRAAYGDAFESPDLVEPNGEYFPDAFALEAESIHRLLRRMLGYAPVSADLEVGLSFLEPDGEVKAGGCGTSACGTGGTTGTAVGGAIETEDGYAALVHVTDAGDPVLLTTALARAIGRIVLFEADEEVDPRTEGALSELTAIAAGLGVLILNGACVYKKACGGMKRNQATFLELEEVALALALFVRTTGAKPATVRRHVEITQREAFDAALSWVDGQPTLVRRLTEEPSMLADGVFELEKRRGLLSRLFGRAPGASLDLDDPGALRIQPRERSEEERRRLAEAKRLVEEALEGP